MASFHCFRILSLHTKGCTTLSLGCGLLHYIFDQISQTWWKRICVIIRTLWSLIWISARIWGLYSPDPSRGEFHLVLILFFLNWPLHARKGPSIYLAHLGAKNKGLFIFSPIVSVFLRDDMCDESLLDCAPRSYDYTLSSLLESLSQYNVTDHQLVLPTATKTKNACFANRPQLYSSLDSFPVWIYWAYERRRLRWKVHNTLCNKP